MISVKPLASSSKGNCYYISDGSSSLLLDAGISIKAIRQGIGFSLSLVAGVLITHSHGDHCKAVKELIKAGVSVYMSEPTKTAQGVSGHRVEVIKERQQFNVGTWTILPFEAQHDCEGALGFLLANRTGEKLLYLTDSYYCKYTFTGLSHILIECNHSYEILDRNVANGSLPAAQKKRLIQSHMSLENAKKFLQANDLSQVQEIWLIHLSDGNSDAALFKREIQQITGKHVCIAAERGLS